MFLPLWVLLFVSIKQIGPADYALFVNSKPVGIIEAKREEEDCIVHEEQSEEYALAKLKYLDNEKLPFVYESTGKLTHFTNFVIQSQELG